MKFHVFKRTGTSPGGYGGMIVNWKPILIAKMVPPEGWADMILEKFGPGEYRVAANTGGRGKGHGFQPVWRDEV